MTITLRAQIIIFILLLQDVIQIHVYATKLITSFATAALHPTSSLSCCLSTSSSSLRSSITSETTTCNHESDKSGVIYQSEEQYYMTMSSSNNKSNTNNKKKGKRLILIRHGTSIANEFMDRPGNRWGDATFTDDGNLVDAPLSQTGIIQAKELQEKMKQFFHHYDSTNDNNMDGTKYKSQQINIDNNLLVVTSPLTRCIETMMIGVIPNLVSPEHDITMKMVVQPLATERVYTASDTGRSVSKLQIDFPQLDFHSCFVEQNIDPHSWWYTTNGNDNIEEWRPFGDGQYYAVPGEPLYHFNQRMVKLFQWIQSREEHTIILVCHWGVIRWLTGEDVKNCDVKELNFDRLVLKPDILESSL